MPHNEWLHETRAASGVFFMSTTATPAPTQTEQSGFTEIDAPTAQRMLHAGECVLIDVREPDEHAAERIEGAKLVPLSSLKVEELARVATSNKTVVMHCKGGKRSADACRLAQPLTQRGIRLHSMAGGIEAWKRHGQPVTRGEIRTGISVMRQVQLTIGVLALTGSVLAWLVHPAFVGIPAFLGAGLIFAGASGTCALATVLSKMPWNKSRATGSCSL